MLLHLPDTRAFLPVAGGSPGCPLAMANKFAKEASGDGQKIIAFIFFEIRLPFFGFYSNIFSVSSSLVSLDH